MPTLTINTNLPADKLPSDFLATTSKVVADSLGKPVSYVVVHINTDQVMSFGGSEELCAVANLYSIGCLSPKENKKHSAALFEHMKNTLGVKKDRMYINFFDVPATDVGYNGKTFAG
uniref:L-dopachrome isomerase n=1 Tax=Haemaphysalis longicornis TaxID=44386 RepID=A0ZSF9_HAELO|nr:macrophage migration inhibitory factor [Haemaphysalis longicornis]